MSFNWAAREDAQLRACEALAGGAQAGLLSGGESQRFRGIAPVVNATATQLFCK